MNEQVERLAGLFVQVREKGFEDNRWVEWMLYLDGRAYQHFDNECDAEEEATRLRAALARFAERLERERET